MSLKQKFFKYGVYYPTLFASRCNVPSRLCFLMNSQYQPLEQIQDYQNYRLQVLFNHVRKNVPWYHDLPDTGRLEDIPYLNKETIRDNPELITDVNRGGNLLVKTTGGSTGTPLKVLKTQHARSWLLACMWRNYSWAGIEVADSRAHLWSTPVGKGKVAQLKAYVGDIINNRRRYSAFVYDKKTLTRYINDIAKYRPAFFYGYASALADIAQRIEELHLELPYFPKAIVSTADILTPEKREVIQNNLRAKVYNEYGCGELGPFVSECDHGNMHISAENYIVEIIRENGERCEPGEVGEVVVTELHNTAMPLLRYRTGDYGALSKETCSCGRTLPLFIGPVGRDRDQFKKEDGTLVHGAYIARFLTEKMLKDHYFGVDGYQFKQYSPKRFEAHIVKNGNYGSHTEEYLTHLFKDTFGLDATLDIIFFDRIPRQKNGKLQLFIGMDK